MAFPHCLPRAELDRQVPPRRTRAIPPGDALQRPPMISPRASHTTLRGRQQRLHNSPDLVREHPITHHSKIITDDLIQNWQTRSSRCVHDSATTLMPPARRPVRLSPSPSVGTRAASLTVIDHIPPGLQTNVGNRREVVVTLLVGPVDDGAGAP